MDNLQIIETINRIIQDFHSLPKEEREYLLSKLPVENEKLNPLNPQYASIRKTFLENQNMVTAIKWIKVINKLSLYESKHIVDAWKSDIKREKTK